MTTVQQSSAAPTVSRRKPYLEFAVIAVGALAFLLSSAFDLFDRLYSFSRIHSEWELDEAIIALAAMAVALVVANVLRLRELQHQTTQLAEAEQKTRRSEARFRALLEHSAEGITLLDPNGRIRYITPAVAQILGSAADYWLGGNFTTRLHPDDAEHVQQLWAKLISQQGETLKAQFRYRHYDDSWRWLDVTATNWLAEPEIEAIVVNFRDISASRQAQADLEQAEQHYRRLVENIPAILYMATLDEVGTALYNSPQIARLGYTQAEYAADPDLWLRNVHPDDRDRIQAEFEHMRATGESFVSEYRVRHPSGRTLWLQDEAVVVRDADGQPVYQLGVVVDITARKDAEAALVARDRRFQALLEHAPDAFALIDTTARFAFVSPATERVLGYMPEQVIGLDPAAFTHPDDLPGLLPLLQGLFQNPGGTVATSYRFRHANGTWRWLETSITNLLHDPAVGGIVFNYHDVTERRQAVEDLRASEQRLRALFEASPIALWEEDHQRVKARLDALREAGVTDLGAYFTEHPDELNTLGALIKVLDVNQTAVTQYHARSKEELLENLDGIFDLSSADLGDNEFTRMAAGEIHFQLDVTNCTLDGERMDVSLNWAVVPGHEQDLARVIVSTIDMTAQRRAAAELRQRLSELEAINRLSAALRETHTMEAMLPLLLRETIGILDATAGSVWLLHPDKQAVYLANEIGWLQTASEVELGRGITGYVAATGDIYIARELSTDARVSEAVRPMLPAGIGGACVPIRTSSQIIGVLFLNCKLPRVFTSDDTRLLSTLAEIAGSAIDRTRLLEQTQRRLSRLSALHVIDRIISSSLDLNLTLTMFLDQVTTELSVDAAAVLLHEEPTGMLVFRRSHGFRTPYLQLDDLRVGEDYAGQAADTRRTVLVGDLRHEPPSPKRRAAMQREGFVGYGAIPLVAKGNVNGVLEIFHRSEMKPDPEWLSFLEALAGQGAIAIDNGTLFANLQDRNVELDRAYDETIEGWSAALDLRDHETEGHSQRVTALTLRLAPLLQIPETEYRYIKWGALLHDIGKMGVPDAVLLKPGPFTPEERAVIERHPTYAYELLAPIEYLRPALDIPHCHHEKWDGTGYPRRLRGEQIPLAARVFAIVDVWDALTSDRPYRKAWPAEKVRAHVQGLSGTHFDPAVVEAFLSLDLSAVPELSAVR